MGARGPQPLPKETLKARGSWRANLRNADVEFEHGRPVRPEWIKGIARAEWDIQVKQLDAAGVLQKTDGAMLACWCETWQEYVLALEELAKLPRGGLIISTGKGGFTANPLVWIKNAAKRQLISLAGQFGFSPAARVGVKSSPEGPGDGPKLSLGTL